MNRIKSKQPSESSDLITQILANRNQRLADLDTSEMMQHLRRSGVVLLRGFDITLGDFEAFSACFCDRFHDVGTRESIGTTHSDGYTSEVFRSNFNLFSHSEGAYRPWPPPPELCFFNCVQSPDSTGGETMLVDGVEFLENLPIGLRKRFEQQGVIYQAHWDEERWHIEFAVPRSRFQAVHSSRSQFGSQHSGR